MVVHICEKSHDELTVHAICDTAMTWDGIAEVFDFKRALEARRKESTERCNEGCKGCKDEYMELHRCNLVAACKREPNREIVSMGKKNRIRGALQARPEISTQILDPGC